MWPGCMPLAGVVHRVYTSHSCMTTREQELRVGAHVSQDPLGAGRGPSPSHSGDHWGTLSHSFEC
jgi:hypothetical protein